MAYEYLEMMHSQLIRFHVARGVRDPNARNRAQFAPSRFRLPFVDQKHASPFVAGGDGDPAKVAQPPQNVLDVPDRVAGVLQLPQQRELPQFRPPQPPRRVPVAPPGLRLDDDHLREAAGPPQELLQAAVAVIQVDPHGDREAEHHVESRLAEPREVPPQRPVAVLRQKVQTLEGHAIRPRIALARSLDQDRVEVHADQGDLRPILRHGSLEEVAQSVREILRNAEES